MPLAVFGKPKRGISGPEIYPEKLRTPISEFIAKNLPTKKPQTDRTLKKPQNKEGQSPKKISEKNGQHFPPRHIENHTDPEMFGEFSEQLSAFVRGGVLVHLALQSGPRGPANIYIYIQEERERERERERKKERPGEKVRVRA